MSQATSQPIATIKKNSREEIRVSLDVYAGHWLLNTRIFFEAEDGSWRPGKGGFAFKVDKLEAYAEAITTALMTAKSKGLTK